MYITSRYLLAAAILERRSEFGWGQLDLARQSGLSQSVISTLERGENKAPRASTLEKLESAMKWDRGTCERLLAVEKIDVYASPFSKNESVKVKRDAMKILGAVASTNALDPLRNPKVYTAVRNFYLKLNGIDTTHLNEDQKSSLFNSITELATGLYDIEDGSR